MPKVRAFKGIRPAPDVASKVVVNPSDLQSIDRIGALKNANELSFLHVVAPNSGSSNDLKAARSKFDDLLKQRCLIQDKDEAIYHFTVEHKGKTHEGLWMATCIDDYLEGHIKKHENTRAAREEELWKFYHETGIDANPVMLTYKSTNAISKILKDYKAEHRINENHVACSEDINYKLCPITDPVWIKKIEKAFGAIENAYIADGHHRMVAAALLGKREREERGKFTGSEDFNYVSCIYFAHDQITVHEYNRLVKDLNGLSVEDLLLALGDDFQVTKAHNGESLEHNVIGMFVNGEWYRLRAKPHTYLHKDAVHQLDVSILQEYILNKLLNIKDPRRDSRIAFMDGSKGLEKLANEVKNGNMSLAFALFPTQVEELMSVADMGAVMPPKSTWVEPKLHSGLVTHLLY